MNLNRGQWHVRLFFWALGIWDEFARNGDTSYQYVDGTNLCHFVRTITVYAPLVILLHGGLIAAAVYSVILLPVELFGAVTYSRILAGLVLLAGAVIGIKALVRYREKRSWMKPEVRIVKAPPPIATGPSFWAIMLEWLISQKKKICPMIRFEQGDL